MGFEKKSAFKNTDTKFSFSGPETDFPSPTGSADELNVGGMTEHLRKALSSGEKLEKDVKAQDTPKSFQKKYDHTKVVFTSNAYYTASEGVKSKGWRRINDAEQREISQIDPYISAIIANRCSQAAVCGYPSDSKFDKGVRVVDLDPPKREDYDSDEEYNRDCRRAEAQQTTILKWVLNCGTDDERVINAAFNDADLTFKHCTLRHFLEAQARNILTFGRAGTQIFRNEDSVPVMFRPVPIETIFNVIEGEKTHVGTGEETYEQSREDLEEYNELDAEERPEAYVQRVDGKNVNFFTEDDLHVWHWQKQALFDLNGYPLSPIEQALYMVFTHHNTLNYLRNQFIKGLANKGMIALESTREGVDISEADMENFRQQFSNFIARNDNSASVPVIGGPVKVNYIPLSPNPRDMEFLQVEEHVIRALCSAFQISPQEMGYGHLSLPQGGITQANKQEDIIKGEERGLRTLLDIVFDGINQIVYENFPEAKERFRVSYVGVGEDTREAVVERQQSELNTTATLSSLYSDSEKQEVVPYGGDVPLSPYFHQNVVRYMKYGDFMEKFFGEEGASKKPEYDFIIDPNLNTAYQQLKVQPVEMQQKQAEMELEGEAMQMEQMEAMAEGGGQMPPEEGGGDDQAGQESEEGQGPPGGGQGEGQIGGDQEGDLEMSEEGGGESLSLRDAWLQRRKLKKSVGPYFSAWLGHHED